MMELVKLVLFMVALRLCLCFDWAQHDNIYGENLNIVTLSPVEERQYLNFEVQRL